MKHPTSGRQPAEQLAIRRATVLVGMITFALSLSLFGSALPVDVAHAAGTSSKTLTINPIKQEYSMWCWAAASQMIAIKIKGSTKTQCAIVKGVKGTTSCADVGATDAQVRSALTFNGLSYTTNYSGIPSASTIKGQIDANKPLLYDYAYKSGSVKHAVVIKGYVYDSSSPTGSTIYWNDPGTGTTKSGSWSYLADNSSWKASFTVYGIS